jgi:uncharacterized membrane protein YqjE
VKLGPGLIITIIAGIASLFIPDTVRLLDMFIVFCLWLMIAVPAGAWLLTQARHQHTPPEQPTELEQLWNEVGPP